MPLSTTSHDTTNRNCPLHLCSTISFGFIPNDVPTHFHAFPPSCGEPAAELIGFGSGFEESVLPIDRALAGTGHRSSPCGASSRAARLACMDAEVGDHGSRNVVPELQTCLVIEPRVQSREDPAQTGFHHNVVVAGKGPNDAW